MEWKYEKEKQNHKTKARGRNLRPRFYDRIERRTKTKTYAVRDRVESIVEVFLEPIIYFVTKQVIRLFKNW